VSKVHNGHHHHVSIVKTVKKNTWIITFGGWMKKMTFQEAKPARVGLATPKSAKLTLPSCQNIKRTLPLHSSHQEGQKKHI
jgi:hypothetical protein